MNKCCNGCGFIGGVFIIVFTFVFWSAAKWIIFAIGILMIFHALFGNKCLGKECAVPKVKAKPKVKKKRK